MATALLATVGIVGSTAITGAKLKTQAQLKLLSSREQFSAQNHLPWNSSNALASGRSVTTGLKVRQPEGERAHITAG